MICHKHITIHSNFVLDAILPKPQRFDACYSVVDLPYQDEIRTHLNIRPGSAAHSDDFQIMN